MSSTYSLPTSFIWRRIHSLMGFWLVIYIFEHLLVNSQAALWIGNDGRGFIQLVNLLESLPYLQVIETLLIGIPLLFHAVWGISRIFTSKSNDTSSDGRMPSLPYKRNRAYSWQRITSWILLVGIIAHVVHMRFLRFPEHTSYQNEQKYLVKITRDEGLYSLTSRLKTSLYTPEDLQQLQEEQQGSGWKKQMLSFSLSSHELLAMAPDPGTAMLLTVRDAFKSPGMALLYTLFVLAAAFHAANGFWTFLITWGIILSMSSQKSMLRFSLVGTLFLAFLGLTAIWGSYWVNLRY